MKPKLFASFPPVRQPKRSAKPIGIMRCNNDQRKTKPKNYTADDFKKELAMLNRMTDKDINLDDIPEMDFDKLGKPVVGKFYRPLKKAISIRLDIDLLTWFKTKQHYQKTINRILRFYMISYCQKHSQKHFKCRKPI